MEAGESAKSLGELKASLRELQNLSIEYGDKSPEAMAKVTAAAGKIKDKIGDIRAETAALSGEGFENVANSANYLRGSLSNLSFTDATQGVKLLTKSLNDIKFEDLSKSVANFSKSLIDLGKALLKNPIFLLVATLVAVVAALIKLKDAGGPVAKMFNEIGDAIDSVVQGLKDMLDYAGITNFAQLEANQKVIDGYKDEISAIDERYSTLLKWAELEKKSIIEISELNIEKAKSDEYSAQKTIESLENIRTINGKLTSDQQKQLEEAKRDRKRYNDDIVYLEAEKISKLKQLNENLQAGLGSLQIEYFNLTNQGNKAIKLEADIRNAEIKKNISQTKIDIASTAKELSEVTRVINLYPGKTVPAEYEAKRKQLQTQLDELNNILRAYEQQATYIRKNENIKLGNWNKEQDDKRFSELKGSNQDKLDEAKDFTDKLKGIYDKSQAMVRPTEAELREVAKRFSALRKVIDDLRKEQKNLTGSDSEERKKDLQKMINDAELGIKNLNKVITDATNENSKMLENAFKNVDNFYNKIASTYIADLSSGLKLGTTAIEDLTVSLGDLDAEITRTVIGFSELTRKSYLDNQRQIADLNETFYIRQKKLKDDLDSKIITQEQYNKESIELDKQQGEAESALRAQFRQQDLKNENEYTSKIFSLYNQRGKMQLQMIKEIQAQIEDVFNKPAGRDTFLESFLSKKEKGKLSSILKEEMDYIDSLEKKAIANAGTDESQKTSIHAYYSNLRTKTEREHYQAVDAMASASAQKKFDFAYTFANSYGSLISGISQMEMNAAGKNEARIKEAKKREFNRNKVLGVANVTINTFDAMMRQYKDVPVWAATALRVLIGAAGAASIAGILGTKYDDGGSSSSGSFGAFTGGGGGGSATGGGVGAGSFSGPSVFSTGFTGQVAHGGPMKMRVSVLESDITKVQDRVRVQEQRSSMFGG